MANEAHWISHGGALDVCVVLRRHVRGLCCLSRLPCPALVLPGDWIFPGRIRNLHDVLATLVSDIVANDRRWIFLQHWSHCGRVRDGLLWHILENGRPPTCAALRQFSVSACCLRFAFSAKTAGLSMDPQRA